MTRPAQLGSLLLCASVASGLHAAETGREVPIGNPGDCTLATAPGDTATAKPVGGLLSIAYDVAVDRAHRVGHQTQRIGGFRIVLAKPVAVSADEARVAFAACGADDSIQVRPLLVDSSGEELSYSPHEADLLLTGGRGSWRDWRTCAFTVSEAGGAQQDIYEASGGDGNAWPDGQLTLIGLEVRLVGSGSDAKRIRGDLTVGRVALRGARVHEDDPTCYADALLTEAGRFRIGIQTRAAFQGPPIHEEVREIEYDPKDPLSRGQRLVLPDGKQRLSWIRLSAERQGLVTGEWSARWERNQLPSASPAVKPVDPTLPPPVGKLRINPLTHTTGVYAAGEAQRITVRVFRGEKAAALRWTITPLTTGQVLAEGNAAITGDGTFQDVVVEMPNGVERSALALHAELTVDGMRVDHVDYQFGCAPASIAPYNARTGMLRGREYVKRQPYMRTTYLAPEEKPFANDDEAVQHFADMLEQTSSITPYVTYMIDVSEFEVLPGVFDTDRLDRLMDAAADRGCAMTIRFAHTQHAPYRWHPYTRPRNWDGAAAKGHAYYGAYAVADEEFIGHWLRAMEVVHARYAKHPAFQGYYLMQPSGEWNVPDQPWNGTITGYAWVEADGFRRYLRETVQPDLAQLNSRWGTTFANWEAVRPPAPDFLRGTKPDLRRQWLDFCRYKQSLEDGWFPRVCKTIRAYDPDHVIIVYGGQQGNGTAQQELLANADYLHNGGNHFLKGEEGLVRAWDRGLGWITEPHHPHRWAAYGDPVERGWVLDWSVYVMTAQAGAGGANMHVYYMPRPSLDLVAHQGGFNALDRLQQYRPILNELHRTRLVETPKQVAVIQDDETLSCKHATVFQSRAEDLRRWFELLKADSVPFEVYVPGHAANYKLLVLNPLDEVMSGASIDTVERLVKDGATVLISGRAGRFCPDAGTEEYPLLRKLGIPVPTGDYRTLDDHAAATTLAGSALFPAGGTFPFYSQADNARDLQDPKIGAQFSLWPYRWIPRSDYFGHFAGAKPGGEVLATFADGGAAVTVHAVGKGRAVICWGTPRADAPELAGFMARLAAWCGVVDPSIGRPIPRMLEARNDALKRSYALLYQERAGTYTVQLPATADGEWYIDDMVSSERFGTYTGDELRKTGLPVTFSEGMPPLKVLRLMPRQELGDTNWIDKFRVPAAR